MSAMQGVDLNPAKPEQQLTLIDRLAPNEATQINSTVAEALSPGIPLSEIPPLTPLYLELREL